MIYITKASLATGTDTELQRINRLKGLDLDRKNSERFVMGVLIFNSKSLLHIVCLWILFMYFLGIMFVPFLLRPHWEPHSVCGRFECLLQPIWRKAGMIPSAESNGKTRLSVKQRPSFFSFVHNSIVSGTNTSYILRQLQKYIFVYCSDCTNHKMS